ncbi:MAG: MATE family efflux transporter [Odoribacter sp.]|nr:MATE family efflux transporter [Odoribacter sp.]
MNRAILRLAAPSIVSNITVPLLGLVDVAITGHFDSTAYIGAIAVGGLIFNMLYWNFGFLRMGTSGLTAQAYGRNDIAGEMRILVQALGVAIVASLMLILLMVPIEKLIFLFIDASPQVAELAAKYYKIVLMGAPALLGLYVFNGWFIGMPNTKYPMFIAIVMNVVNICASLILVYLFDMKIEGVALGTLIAQYAGVGIAVALWLRRYRGSIKFCRLGEALNLKELRNFFTLNSAIFFRTLCLISVTTIFTWVGGKQGDTILAVNTLLMQLFTIFSYILDGFAYAAESLVGRYTGAMEFALRRKSIIYLFRWSTLVMVIFTLAYLIAGQEFLSLLTDNVEVLNRSTRYFYWVLAVPLCGFAAFLWDGILIGATATKEMFWAMLVAAIAFFAILFLPPILSPDSGVKMWSEQYNNDRLWLAFLTYLVLRGVVQHILWLPEYRRAD